MHFRGTREAASDQQSPNLKDFTYTITAPGYFTIPETFNSCDTQAKPKEKEDIHEVDEISKQLKKANYLSDPSEYSQQTLDKAVYIGGNVTDLNHRGYVRVDDITIQDRLNHSEFVHMVRTICNAKSLLFTAKELSKEEEKQKRTLLALLSNLNWRIRDIFIQARLLRSVDKRLQMLRGCILDPENGSV